jgi:hypothetical protein
MHLTTNILDIFARHSRDLLGGGTCLIQLEEDDVLSYISDPRADNSIVGPAIVELTVFRDGGWRAREVVYETAESVALAASLAQRHEVYSARNQISDRWEPR